MEGTGTSGEMLVRLPPHMSQLTTEYALTKPPTPPLLESLLSIKICAKIDRGIVPHVTRLFTGSFRSVASTPDGDSTYPGSDGQMVSVALQQDDHRRLPEYQTTLANSPPHAINPVLAALQVLPTSKEELRIPDCIDVSKGDEIPIDWAAQSFRR